MKIRAVTSSATIFLCGQAPPQIHICGYNRRVAGLVKAWTHFIHELTFMATRHHPTDSHLWLRCSARLRIDSAFPYP